MLSVKRNARAVKFAKIVQQSAAAKGATTAKLKVLLYMGVLKE